MLLHKLLYDKESELPLAYHLAVNNYFVVILDLLNHGDRECSFRSSNKLDFNKIFTGIGDSINDIREVISYVSHEFDKEITEDSFNIIGTSYGGMLALTAGYLLEEVKVVASINSSACWRGLVENGSFEMFRLFSSSKPVVDIKQVSMPINRFDPYMNVEKYNLRPILLLNGAKDTTFTFQLIEPFYNKLMQYYEDNNALENVTWLKYQRVGHQLVHQMIEDLIVWLNKWNKK